MTARPTSTAANTVSHVEPPRPPTSPIPGREINLTSSPHKDYRQAAGDLTNAGQSEHDNRTSDAGSPSDDTRMIASYTQDESPESNRNTIDSGSASYRPANTEVNNAVRAIFLDEALDRSGSLATDSQLDRSISLSDDGDGNHRCIIGDNQRIPSQESRHNDYSRAGHHDDPGYASITDSMATGRISSADDRTGSSLTGDKNECISNDSNNRLTKTDLSDRLECDNLDRIETMSSSYPQDLRTGTETGNVSALSSDRNVTHISRTTKNVPPLSGDIEAQSSGSHKREDDMNKITYDTSQKSTIVSIHPEEEQSNPSESITQTARPKIVKPSLKEIEKTPLKNIIREQDWGGKSVVRGSKPTESLTTHESRFITEDNNLRNVSDSSASVDTVIEADKFHLMKNDVFSSPSSSPTTKTTTADEGKGSSKNAAKPVTRNEQGITNKSPDSAGGPSAVIKNQQSQNRSSVDRDVSSTGRNFNDNTKSPKIHQKSPGMSATRGNHQHPINTTPVITASPRAGRRLADKQHANEPYNMYDDTKGVRRIVDHAGSQNTTDSYNIRHHTSSPSRGIPPIDYYSPTTEYPGRLDFNKDYDSLSKRSLSPTKSATTSGFYTESPRLVHGKLIMYFLLKQFKKIIIVRMIDCYFIYCCL